MINEHSFQAEGLSDKHKLLFAQRKAEFLQDFGEDVAALDAAEKEVRLLSILMIRVFNGCKFSSHPDQVEKMLKKMPGLDKSKEDSRSITTIQGRGGKEKTPNSNGAQVRDLISELKETGSQIDINDIVSLRGLLPTPPPPTLLSMAHHRTQPGSSTDPGLIL